MEEGLLFVQNSLSHCVFHEATHEFEGRCLLEKKEGSSAVDRGSDILNT